MATTNLHAVCDFSITNLCNAAWDFCGFARDETLICPARYVDLDRDGLLASLLIKFAQNFMNIGPASDRELAWSIGILIAFVLSALLLGVMNRISPGEHS